MTQITKSKAGWNFDNSYARLPEFFYSRQLPEPVSEPKLVICNESLARHLGLNAEALQNEEGIEVLAGNKIPHGAEPLAQAYAGHQFGNFTMLGDGRAVLLGEHVTPEGKRVDIALKGSGRTPYSRGGDGRAVLGPMLREYIISEAMHALGIPTSRSLAVVMTGEPVMREEVKPGAVLVRAASSHIRVGTFEYAYHWGSIEDLKTLADYAIERHDPSAAEDDLPYQSLLHGVIRRQAALIAKWQLVGFIHGVMNTDNMALSGETIDYGPCAFMDAYDPKTVFSSIDVNGRYAYGKQPYIGAWNLARFAETLLPLLHPNQDVALAMAEEAIEEFPELYHQYWLSGMRAKLGLSNEEEQDEALVKELLQMMEKHRADYTNTFRALTMNELDQIALFKTDEFKQWHETWRQRLERQPGFEESAKHLMQQNNPSVIPRNWRVEEALEAADNGDFSVMQRLLDVLSDPYAYSSEQEPFAQVKEMGENYRTFCGT